MTFIQKDANMKRLFLILLGLIFSLNSKAQDSLLIERESNEYYVDTLYTQIDYIYKNVSTNNYVLWIEKNNVSTLPENEIIRNYFFVHKGDFSLMGLMWDGNVGSFVPGLFSSFMKIIKPKEQFIVSIIIKGDMCNEPEEISQLEKHIQIVDVNKIRGLTVGIMTNQFDYKANNITVLYEWLNK